MQHNAPDHPTFSTLRALALLLYSAILLILGGALWQQFGQWQTAVQREQQSRRGVSEVAGLRGGWGSQLADRFTDADGDLVADTLEDAQLPPDPDSLVFSYIAGDEASRQASVWDGLIAELSRGTGKQVTYAYFETLEEQLAALEQGRLHITALNTGSVPTAVNRNGFVPLCTLGREDGQFGYTMKVLVPTTSPLRSAAELKGKTILFTEPTSNSGYKAAVVALLRDHRLRPGDHFDLAFSHGHEASIREVALGTCAAAPVASDLLARAIRQGEIKESQFRVLLESERFPPAAIGCAFSLRPALRDALLNALLECDWKKTGLEPLLSADGESRFVPVLYKRDWEVVRRIEECFGGQPFASVSGNPPSVE